MAKSSGVPSGSLTRAQILERMDREKVRFMRLQFTDILGTIKNVEVAERQFEQALDGEVMFDGSSIEGLVSGWQTMVVTPPAAAPSPDAVARAAGGGVQAVSVRSRKPPCSS